MFGTLPSVDSIFYFITFYAMLHPFGAGAALFQTGWFIESMTTQSLVVFCIRTRLVAWRSRPDRFLVGTTLGSVLVAVLMSTLPVGRWFGFVPPPPLFFAFLAAAIIAYLALVEVAKLLFYRTIGPIEAGSTASGIRDLRMATRRKMANQTSKG